MVGITSSLKPLLSIPSPLFPFPFSSLTLKPQQPFISKKPKPKPLLAFAVSSNNNNNNELKEKGKTQEKQPSSNGQDDVNNSSKQRRPIFGFNLNTLFDPDPDNVIALGLTGLLTWASVQVLWQLLFISLAILVAALKYSFIAALLIFILIALL